MVVTLLSKEKMDKGGVGGGPGRLKKNNLTDKYSLEIWQMLVFSPTQCWVLGVSKIFYLPECELSLSTLPKTLLFCDMK